jgi:membrane dipeptidase
MVFQKIWSRRHILLSTVMTSGAAVTPHPRSVWATDATDSRVAGMVARTIRIDTHNHVDVPLSAAEMPGPDIDLKDEMKRWTGLRRTWDTLHLQRYRVSRV